MNYKLRIAMIATEKQYNDDLKPSLLKMGKQDNTWGDWNDDTYLTSSFKEIIGNYSKFIIKDNSLIIEDYNPKLFLALAAMTDKEDGNVGEYWKFIGNGVYCGDGFTHDKLYKQIKSTVEITGAFEDNNGSSNGFYTTGSSNQECFVKATQEEIIAYFSKKENPIKIGIGDIVRVKPGSRWISCYEFNNSGTWGDGNKTFDQHFNGFNERKTQYVYKFDDKYVYIDDTGYSGHNYIMVDKENVELETKIEKNTDMKNRTLTPKNAQRIIDMACLTWKQKLADQWATSIVLVEDIWISEIFYTEMRKACTTDQNKVFDEIFGSDDQLINITDLNIGESMIVCKSDNSWGGTIISRIWTAKGEENMYVNMNDTSCTWSPNPKFKGKKVKLTITHEEVK
jgi:hypothetical protein